MARRILGTMVAALVSLSLAACGAGDFTCLEPPGPEGFFAGGIDDVRLYRRALAADEIAALAAG